MHLYDFFRLTKNVCLRKIEFTWLFSVAKKSCLCILNEKAFTSLLLVAKKNLQKIHSDWFYCAYAIAYLENKLAYTQFFGGKKCVKLVAKKLDICTGWNGWLLKKIEFLYFVVKKKFAEISMVFVSLTWWNLCNFLVIWSMCRFFAKKALQKLWQDRNCMHQ